MYFFLILFVFSFFSLFFSLFFFYTQTLKSFCKQNKIAKFFNQVDNENPFRLQFGKQIKCCHIIFNFYWTKANEKWENGFLNAASQKRKYRAIMTNAKDRYILSLVFVIVFVEFMNYIEEIKLFDHLARSRGNGNVMSMSRIKKHQVSFVWLVLKCFICETVKLHTSDKFINIFPLKTTCIVPSSIAYKLICKALLLDSERTKTYAKAFDQLCNEIDTENNRIRAQNDRLKKAKKFEKSKAAKIRKKPPKFAFILEVELCFFHFVLCFV